MTVSPSQLFTLELKQLFVIKRLMDSQRGTDKVVPAQVMDKLREISRTVSSLPTGYSWACRLIQTLNPSLEIASDKGAAVAADALSVESAEEEIYSIFFRFDHIAILIENGAFPEARELFESMDAVSRESLYAYLGESFVLFDPTASASRDPAFLSKEAEKFKKYKVLIATTKMLDFCDSAHSIDLTRWISMLPSSAKTEISLIMQTLISKNPELAGSAESADACLLEDKDVSLTVKIAAISIFEASQQRIQRQTVESSPTIYSASSESCFAGAGGAGGAVGKSPVSSAASSAAANDNLEFILRIAGKKFRSMYGFNSGMLSNILAFFRSNLKDRLLLQTPPWEMNFDKIVYDLIIDISENKLDEASVRCRFLLLIMARSMDDKAFISLAELCNSSTVQRIMSEDVPSDIDNEEAFELDASYLRAAHRSGCLAAFDLAKIESSYFYPIKAFAAALACTVIQNVDNNPFFVGVKFESEDILKSVSVMKRAAINKFYSKTCAARKECVRLLNEEWRNLGEHAKVAVATLWNPTLDRILETGLKNVNANTLQELSQEVKISAGQTLVCDKYSCLVQSQKETLHRFSEFVRVVDRVVDVTTSELIYNAFLLDESVTDEYIKKFSGVGVEGAIEGYKKSHTEDEIIALFKRKGFDASNIFRSIKVYRELAIAIRTLLRDVERMQSSYESEFIAPIARLRVLMQEGMIKRTKAAVEVTPVAVLRKRALVDGFGHKVTLPAPPVVCEMPLPDVSPVLAPEESSSISSIEESEVLTASDETAHSSIEEQVVAVLHSLEDFSEFKVEPARKAFSNGLQYGLVIHHLLVSLRGTPTPQAAKQIHTDIAVASYYALEQITTALLLQKHLVVDLKNAKDLYEVTGHNLLLRCELADVKLPIGIRNILHVLNEKNLRQVHSLPGTSADRDSFTADALSIYDVNEARSGGLDAMKALLWFLRYHCISPSSKHFPALALIQDAVGKSVVPHPSLREDLTEAASLSPASIAPAPRPPVAIVESEDLSTLQSVVSSSLADPAIDLKIERLRYCAQNLQDPDKPQLARFYIQQANYILLDILESAFCRAAELQGSMLDQKFYRHRLDSMASDLGLAGLTQEEQTFLANAYRERNIARYNFDFKGHVDHLASAHSFRPRTQPRAATTYHRLEETAGLAHKVALLALGTKVASGSKSEAVGGAGFALEAASLAADDAGGGAFTTVLSSSDARLKGKMARSISLALSIVQKLATHLAVSSK